MAGYVIGVDGGNTKTHYSLFDSSGNLINFIEAGTASHEQLKDGFDSAGKELGKRMDELLREPGLDINDIGFGVFGLAGADTRKQYVELGKRIERIGFTNYRVYNDAFLGIKAGIEKGYGICSINGTGTSCVGVDRNGGWIQVGGVGPFSGDDAGGGYLSNMVIRLVYESIFKCGPQTIMKDMLFSLLGISDEDLLIETVQDKGVKGIVKGASISRIAFFAAGSGDEIAAGLLKHIGYNTARAVIGAYRRLDFSGEKEIDIIMAGSIYVKGENQILNDAFKNEVAEKIPVVCKFNILEQPPVAGAALWALEEFNGCIDTEVRRKVLESFHANKPAPALLA